MYISSVKNEMARPGTTQSFINTCRASLLSLSRFLTLSRPLLCYAPLLCHVPLLYNVFPAELVIQSEVVIRREASPVGHQVQGVNKL